MATIYTKDPQAVLDYCNDWSSWLPGNDTIQSSAWSADEGITIDSDERSDTATVVWLSGGTIGIKYAVTNHIITTAGREDDRTFYVKIKNK